MPTKGQSNTDSEDDFELATIFAKENGSQLSKETQLKMYTMFKQATEGDLPLQRPRPSIFSPIERAKYDARVSTRGIKSIDAKSEYVRIVLEAKIGFSLPKREPAAVGGDAKRVTDPVLPFVSQTVTDPVLPLVSQTAVVPAQNISESEPLLTPSPPSEPNSVLQLPLSPRKSLPAKTTVQQLMENVFVESGCLRTFMINFLLVYNLRFGVALLGRIVTLARTHPRTLLDLGEVLSEKHMLFREEAVRMGLFAAWFGGVYIALKRFLLLFFKDRVWYDSMLSGMVAGCSSFYWMHQSWHRTLALYSATRAVQCFYNFSKSRGYFHFWGSSWVYGDSLLFGISSAQIMYSYVMRPNALPASYYHFIRKQGPLDEVILQSVRDSCRHVAVNTQALFAFVLKKGGPDALKEVQDKFDPLLIPTRALHVNTNSALKSSLFAAWNVAQQIFGVYLSLALVPQVVLHFQKFMKRPGHTVWNSIQSALQSTLFLSTFCGGYQFFIVCVQRPLLERFGLKDHKLWYYVAGCFASLSILIERKSRRSELALYAFPRAADALYLAMSDYKLVSPLPQGEMLLFASSMGLITFFYDNDPECLSPAVVSVLKRFIPKEKEKKAEIPERPESALELGEEPVPTPHMISFGGSSLIS